MRRILFVLTAVILTIVLSYAWQLWNQNKTVSAPSADRIEQSLQAGIVWLVKNEKQILAQNNPMLWWMLQQSALQSKDPRLDRLFAQYQQQHLLDRSSNLWKPLFVENSWVPIRYEQIRHYPYYNKHFFYSLTCDQDLLKIAEIGEQNAPDFCDAHPLRPACATHQLMGILMQQRKNCTDAAILQQTIASLQERIIDQLTWDPRVVDVYLQRVLMLLESGAAQRVKSIWLQHVLDAQSKEGGWGNFEPLLPLGGGNAIGFTQRGLGIQKRRDTFHATVQGVYIMSLLGRKP